MIRQTFYLLTMTTMGMFFQVSNGASEYAHINHNLYNFWQTQHPQNKYPGQNAELGYQNDGLLAKTKRTGKGWILGSKDRHGKYALLCHNFLCVKIPIRAKQVQRNLKEKRGMSSHTVDGRIRL